MAIQTVAADSHLRSSQTMGLASSSAVSITCWISANWNVGGRRSFVGIYGPSTDVALGAPVTAVQIGTGNGTNDIMCWTWGGGTLVTLAASMSAYNNVWTHIAYTYDGTTHSLYRNGILLATNTAAQIAGFLNQIYINGYPGSGTGESDAFQTDQYTLYRRTLTPGEVLTSASSFGSRHGIVNGVIARFEFDGGTGLVSNELDLSGNGHNLTFTGTGTAPSYSYINTIASSNIRRVQ